MKPQNFVVLAIALGLVGLLAKQVVEAPEKERSANNERISAMHRAHLAFVKAFLNRHMAQKEEAWIEVTPENPFAEPARSALAGNFESIRSGIPQLFQNYVDTSPLAGQIAKHFDHVAVAIESRGGGIVGFGQDGPKIGAQKTFTLVFVGVDRVPPGRSPAEFRGEDKYALLVAARWPKGLGDGVIMHLAGNTMRFQSGAESAHQSAKTIVYYQEEVELHEMEALVIDRALGGKYLPLIDKIVSRTGPQGSVAEVIYSVSAGDMEAVEKLFDSKNSGPRVASTALEQVCVMAALRWIDRHAGGHAAAKANALAFLESPGYRGD